MYQCCADYTTIEGVREAAENLERQFEFDFEYLIDAKLTFKHKKAETVEEKQEIDTEKDTRRCFFTRVHIKLVLYFLIIGIYLGRHSKNLKNYGIN